MENKYKEKISEIENKILKINDIISTIDKRIDRYTDLINILNDKRGLMVSRKIKLETKKKKFTICANFFSRGRGSVTHDNIS